MTETTSVPRSQGIVINRITASVAVILAMAGYFWQPIGGVQYALDILVRAYLSFVAGAMAHEAAHGHLGRSKSSNLWWGRLAMIPTTVPFLTFRKTHLRHHAATNVPEADPDAFLNTKKSWEIPLRTLALPHHWTLWLCRHGHWTRRDTVEYLATYLIYFTIYGAIAAFVGVERVALGLFPALPLHALLLWYGFAMKTHEGYSTGTPQSRSHNYYGRGLYWFSFGLSMHRLHHLKPGLAWLQMRNEVPSGTWTQCLRFERDIQPNLGSTV